MLTNMNKSNVIVVLPSSAFLKAKYLRKKRT